MKLFPFFPKLFLSFGLLLTFSLSGQTSQAIIQKVSCKQIRCGADQTTTYFPLLSNKNIAVVTNQSGLIDHTHLIDSLMNAGFKIKKVFSPEHGFRGNEEAGKLIDNQLDKKTGIPLISLYGKNKKPQKSALENIDLVLFDLQDVGVRFYTYISTLTYVMEACTENGIPLIILDRPNPNGFYIDGPVLEAEFHSFVGLHPVPVIYGLTIGEYSLMVKGEKWIKDAEMLDLTVIPLKGYARNMLVELPVAPSPNLPNWESVYLYPSLCFFEGTIVSVGRGTNLPFQLYGHPDLKNLTFQLKFIFGNSELVGF